LTDNKTDILISGFIRDFQIFKYPLLSQERVNLRTSNLADVFKVTM